MGHERWRSHCNRRGLGHKNDYAVKTVLKKHPDGRVEVVSSEPIGRTIDFNDPASRQKVIDEIRNFKL